MPKRRMKRHAVTQPLDPSYRLIALTQGQNAIVDAADFEWLSQWNWYAHWDDSTKSFYADRGIGKRTLQMSRVILGCEPGKEADHINHDTLDNRRGNLRSATHSQNQCNRRVRSLNPSGFVGVTWDRKGAKWQAQIMAEGRNCFLGRFLCRKEAARAYDAAARKYRGESATLNFPNEAGM